MNESKTKYQARYKTKQIFKCMLSMLLSLSMLLPAFPARVMAGEIISTVSIDQFDFPVSGEALDTDYRILSVGSLENVSGTAAVKWYDQGLTPQTEVPGEYSFIPAGTALESGAVAVGGHHYAAVMYFEPSADNFEFDDKVAFEEGDYLGRRLQASYVVKSTQPEPRVAVFLYFIADTTYGGVMDVADIWDPIELDIEGFNGYLAAGAGPWTAEQISSSYQALDHFDLDVSWKNDERPLEEGEKFMAGENYTLDLTFSSSARKYGSGRGKFISKEDVPLCNILNDYQKITVSENGYSGKASFTFPCAGGISDISLTGIREPKAGELPQTEGFVPDSTVKNALKAGAVSWEHYTTGVFAPMAENECFIAGDEYLLSLTVEISAENYFFTGLSENAVTLNTGKLQGLSISEDARSAQLRILFTMAPQISGPVIISVTEPVVGSVPVFNADVSGTGCGLYNAFDRPFINGVYWKDISEDPALGEDLRVLGEESIFRAGHSYELRVAVAAKEPFSFPVDENGNTGISVQINGKDAEIISADPSCIIASLRFDPLPGDYDSTVLINKVAVQMFAPVAGEKPVYGLTTADDAAYEPDMDVKEAGVTNGICWMEVADKNSFTGSVLQENDVFENGKYYMAKVWLKADKDACFVGGLDADLSRITVNGRSASKAELNDINTELILYIVFEKTSDIKLKELQITTPPVKTEYRLGESFDPSGMGVTAVYEDDSSETVEDYIWTPAGALPAGTSMLLISCTRNGVTKSAQQPITLINSGSPEPAQQDMWNLFTDASAREFTVRGLGASVSIKNTNAKSAKYYDAMMFGNTISVSLKEGVKRSEAAKAANSLLEFDMGEKGSVQYVLPVCYVRPVLKLSEASVTIKSGTETTVRTRLLCKNAAGVFEPFCAEGLKLQFGDRDVHYNKSTGIVSFKAQEAIKGKKLAVSAPGWDGSCSLSFTVKTASKGVLSVDLKGAKQVVVNSNAPKQVLEYSVLLNGGVPLDGAVELVDKKNSGLASYENGKLKIAYKDGVKKGSYVVSLKSNDGAVKKIKIKVSDKALDDAITLKLKSRYNIASGQSMVLVPDFKDVSGSIEYAEAAWDALQAHLDGAGNIVLDYTGEEIEGKDLKFGMLLINVKISGIDQPLSLGLRNAVAEKLKPAVRIAPVRVPANVQDKEVLAASNIVSTYKDSAGVVHSIRLKKVEITGTKGVEAVVNASDLTEIDITKMSGKSGTVNILVTFRGNITKKLTLKVKKG